MSLNIQGHAQFKMHPLGRFKIVADFLDFRRDNFSVGDEPILNKIFGSVVILGADYLPDENCYEYVAYGSVFEPIPDEQKAPYYNIIRNPDGSLQWNRVP